MKELIKKLTEHYAWCIENIPEEGFLDFCIENKVHAGICLCSSSIFDERISSTQFLEEYMKPSNIYAFFCKPPCLCTSFKEALETLRTRHKRLLEMADYKE